MGSEHPKAAMKRLVVLKDLVDDLTSFVRAPDRLDAATAVLGTILPSNNLGLIKTMSSRRASGTIYDSNQEDTGEEATGEDDAMDDDKMSALAWIKEEILVISERGFFSCTRDGN